MPTTRGTGPTLKELQAKAKAAKVKGWSKMNKAELLSKVGGGSTPAPSASKMRAFKSVTGRDAKVKAAKTSVDVAQKIQQRYNLSDSEAKGLAKQVNRSINRELSKKSGELTEDAVARAHIAGAQKVIRSYVQKKRGEISNQVDQQINKRVNPDKISKKEVSEKAYKARETKLNNKIVKAMEDVAYRGSHEELPSMAHRNLANKKLMDARKGAEKEAEMGRMTRNERAKQRRKGKKDAAAAQAKRSSSSKPKSQPTPSNKRNEIAAQNRARSEALRAKHGDASKRLETYRDSVHFQIDGAMDRAAVKSLEATGRRKGEGADTRSLAKRKRNLRNSLIQSAARREQEAHEKKFGRQRSASSVADMVERKLAKRAKKGKKSTALVPGIGRIDGKNYQSDDWSKQQAKDKRQTAEMRRKGLIR